MKTQVPVFVLITLAVTTVAHGGTIVHMDRKDSDDGKVRTRELEGGQVESELAVSGIERRSLPADQFAIPKGFTQATMGGGNE